MGFVANSDDARRRVRDAARIVLFLGHVVDDVPLDVLLLGSRAVDGADDVHLVVLERDVALVHVDDVVRVVNAEDWIRGIPVNIRQPYAGHIHR